MADDEKLKFDDMYGGSAETYQNSPGKVSGTPTCRSAHSFMKELRNEPCNEPIAVGE